MLVILLLWAIQIALLHLIGVALSTALWGRLSFRWIDAVWVGLAGTIAYAQVWHFFFPLNRGAWALPAAAALAGMVTLARSWRSAARPFRWWRRLNRRALVPWALVLLLTALSAMGVAQSSKVLETDTLSYHLNAVAWLNAYPEVPGLANLHYRLAFNSGFLVYAVLVDNGPFDHRSAWVTAGLLPALTLLHLFCGGPVRGRDALLKVFAVLSLPFLVRVSASSGPTLYQDVPCQCVILVLTFEALRDLLNWEAAAPAALARQSARTSSW